MRWSLPISLMLHLAVLLAAMVVLPSPEAYRVRPQEALPVEIVDISEMSKRTAMRREAPEKPVKKPAPPKPEKKAEPVKKPVPKPAKEVSRPQPKPAPPPTPAPAPTDKTEKAPAPLKKAPQPPDADALRKLAQEAAKQPENEPEPKPKTEAKPQRKPAPRPRVRPRAVRRLAAAHRKRQDTAKPVTKKREDPIDEIAALLNKVDDKPKAPPPEATRTGTPRRGPADLSGDESRLAADLVDALRQRIESCWNVPVGVRDAEGLRVKVRFQLAPDGSISGGPVVLNHMNHPAFEAAAGSAVRAIAACAPYDFLPPDRYDLWKDVILNFDPARMLATN